MSATVIIPPPNSSSLQRRVPRLTAKARALLTAMNLHFAGLAAFAVLVLYLLIHLFLVWQGLKATDADAIDQQRVKLISAEIAARPLRGLDEKLVASTRDADEFYKSRLPYATSQVASEIGALSKRENVRWAQAQYAYGPVLSGDYALTEIKIDANVSGDYRPIVQFINALERDKVFFVINGINLTGQQTGQVNLRIRVTTYLRAPQAGEMNAEQVPVSDAAQKPAGGVQ
jgi:type IV pilus assembly protein PilO